MSIKRGEIYCADLNPVIGSEQGGVRNVVVLQAENEHNPMVIVAPIKNDSFIILEQTQRIDKAKLKEKIGCLSDNKLSEIDNSVINKL